VKIPTGFFFFVRLFCAVGGQEKALSAKLSATLEKIPENSERQKQGIRLLFVRPKKIESEHLRSK
jgi:hypothetical protein